MSSKSIRKSQLIKTESPKCKAKNLKPPDDMRDIKFGHYVETDNRRNTGMKEEKQVQTKNDNIDET